MKNLSRVAIFISLLAWAFSGQAADPLTSEKIDINTASFEELLKIIHIGEVRARELISLRPFSSLDDLIRIKGIGEKNLEDIKKQGLAWVAEAEFSPMEPEPEILPKTEASSIFTEDVPIIYPTAIIFNEILPSPTGPDEMEEWIEIFNQNEFEVNLSNWRISDTMGSIKTYTFPKESKILPKGYLILPRPVTKITLNNDADGLKLIQPDGNVIDHVTYEKAPKGQSYNRTATDWIWSTNLTPGSENIVSAPQVFEQKIKEEKTEKGLAAISRPFQQIQEKEIPKSFFSLLIASTIAIFSGIIILLLKKRLKLRDKKI